MTLLVLKQLIKVGSYQMLPKKVPSCILPVVQNITKIYEGNYRFNNTEHITKESLKLFLGQIYREKYHSVLS